MADLASPRAARAGRLSTLTDATERLLDDFSDLDSPAVSFLPAGAAAGPAAAGAPIAARRVAWHLCRDAHGSRQHGLQPQVWPRLLPAWAAACWSKLEAHWPARHAQAARSSPCSSAGGVPQLGGRMPSAGPASDGQDQVHAGERTADTAGDGARVGHQPFEGGTPYRLCSPYMLGQAQSRVEAPCTLQEARLRCWRPQQDCRRLPGCCPTWQPLPSRSTCGAHLLRQHRAAAARNRSRPQSCSRRWRRRLQCCPPAQRLCSQELSLHQRPLPASWLRRSLLCRLTLCCLSTSSPAQQSSRLPARQGRAPQHSWPGRQRDTSLLGRQPRCQLGSP